MPLSPTDIASLIATSIACIGSGFGCLSSMAVIAAAFVGLRTWRRELRGSNQYDLAKKLLLTARQFREAVFRSRGMMTFAAEYEEREITDDEQPNEKRIMDEYYARNNRMKPVRSLIPELEQVAWECEIVTGQEITPIVREMKNTAWELNQMIHDYFERQIFVKRGQWELTKEEQEQARKDKKTIYQYDNDEYIDRIDAALDELEKKLRKYIR